jgi:NADH dehydrogenase FAD-containing subunit
MTKQPIKVIVIGAGYAGLLAAVRLAGKTRGAKVDLTLVNASEVFVERLRLHQWAANQNIVWRPLVDILQGTGVKFLQGYVNLIDPHEQEIVVQRGTETQRMEYDYLLYALGSTINRDAVPGVREHAYTLTPSGTLSATALREKLPALQQQGGRVVVVGGGATGIEAAAEFAESFPNLKVLLVTQDSVGTFTYPKVAAYMRRSLERLGVTIYEHTPIREVTANELVTAEGTRLPHTVCLWAGGFTVPSIAREAGLTVNERGQILIDPYMRSLSHPNIYGLGDAAHPAEEPGVPVRMAAFTAAVMGAHAADNLSAVLRGKTPKPLSFAYYGQGIALGRHDAIGFNTFPHGNPVKPYLTGKVGYEFREFFVRFLANMPSYERRVPGLFIWMGKGRYAAAKRRTQSQQRIHQST